MYIRTILTVFSRPFYLVLFVGISFVVFTISVWLPNTALIHSVLTSDTVAFGSKVSLLWSLYGAIGTNFTIVSASYTVAIAILFGMNISLLVYYIRKVSGGVKNIRITSAAGIGGLISGIFGIGCAACGTFILTSVLALVGAGSFVTFLPFGGEEFGFLGVGLLLYSVYAISGNIQNSFVCTVE